MQGSAGNIGMYASGIPLGVLIDKRGPRWGVLIGAVSLACGYFPLYSAYKRGPDSIAVSALCFFSFLTGMGSCSAFSGALKVCATNWPHHRGTATAFPLSGFGLSAFAFTLISGFAFPDNTANYLLMLAIGTFSMVFGGSLFLRMHPPQSPYAAVPTDDEGRPAYKRHDSNEMQRSRSTHSRHSSKGSVHGEPGKLSFVSFAPHAASICPRISFQQHAGTTEVDETSSLMSGDGPGDLPEEAKSHSEDHHLHKHPDITGVALLRNTTFWKQFIMLGLLCGVGLMTINNIGNDAKALWRHYDDSASHDFVQKRQLMHVSILSFFSFVGRLSSGIGSDVIVKRLHSSRYWSLVASACIFTLAQITALTIENPNQLFWLSSLTGLGYGALFGVYPALVADAFGAKGMGINWGAMTMSPVVSGNVFNLAYGRILDSHSDFVDGGDRVCGQGKDCYSQAYIVTLVASVLGVMWSLWCVRHEWVEKQREKRIEAHQG